MVNVVDSNENIWLCFSYITISNYCTYVPEHKLKIIRVRVNKNKYENCTFGVTQNTKQSSSCLLEPPFNQKHLQRHCHFLNYIT